MSENYIKNHFCDIKGYANVIEKRLDDDCCLEGILEDNKKVLILCEEYGLDYILIDKNYQADIYLKVEK